MSDHDLLDGPTRLDSELLRQRADRLLLLYEFAVAYEYTPRTDSGFLSVWVRQDHVETTAPQYIREQSVSGDHEDILDIFGEMATGQCPDRMEQFISERQ